LTVENRKTFELPATTNTDAVLAWNSTGNVILFVNTLGTTSISGSDEIEIRRLGRGDLH